MGVYIPNMKMPTACFKCRFCTALECFASGKYIKDHYKRTDDCPLVEVKVPHGDLIDYDRLYDITGRYDGELPVIIEAEGKDDG